jgi:hypothetical protein
MSIGRYFFTLTLLNDGRVLALGGVSGTVPNLASASFEIFDPTTDTWSAPGALLIPKENHSAVLRADGRVLVTGGYETSSSELFDPQTGQWSVAPPMVMNRMRHATFQLPDGRVLTLGGAGYSFFPYHIFPEIFLPGPP